MKIDYYVELVRARLTDDGSKTKTKDTFGNDVLMDTQLYTDKQILLYLEGSLQRLNLLFTKGLSFTGTELEVYELADLVIQGAVITALASKALLEKGREFAWSDGSVDYQPSNLSDTMMRQWEVETVDYRSKIELLMPRISKYREV